MECALDPGGVRQVRDWLASGAPGVAWLTGAPGSGMTRMVKHETRECEAVWMVATDLKSRNFLKDVCSSAWAVNFKRKVLVLDELDAILRNEAVMADVGHVVKHYASRLPIVCILKATRAATTCELVKKATLVVHFDPPPPERMMAAVRSVLSEEGVPCPDARLRELCEAAPGDIRHVLQTLRASSDAIRDISIHTADAVKRVFGDVCGVREALRLFETDPGALASGVFEAYPQAARRVEDMVAHADNASLADVVDEHIHATQRWDLLELHGALTVASAALTVPKHKDTRLTKYGTVWNKTYIQASKAKLIRGINASRAASGLTNLTGLDLAVIRTMLEESMKRSPSDAATLCRAAGLGAQQALGVMRLWDSGYKLSTHARLKKALAETAGPSPP